MKKFLLSTLVLSSILALTSCNTTKEDPLTFPTIEPCSVKLIDSKESYICIQEQEATDLIETNVKFDNNSFTLDEESKKILYKLFAYLKLSGSPAITIRGYTGKVDSKLIHDKELLVEHDIRLSKNRAISVREYLVNKGLNSESITIKALGYQDPIAPNDSNENRALNQRVEITVKSKLLEQIDNIEGSLKHVTPSNYKKFFSNVYLLNEDQDKDIAQIYDSREKRPVLANGFKIFADKEYPINFNNEPFILVTKPKLLESFNEDKKVYRLGTASYDYTFKGITALTIKNLSREANVGDYIGPTDLLSKPLPEKTFRMKSKITGNVMEDVMNTNTFSSTYNTVLINKGTADGLELGAEMLLYEPESRTDGFPVPPKFTGYGFVYRQSEHYSLVIIINSLQEISSKSMATTIL